MRQEEEGEVLCSSGLILSSNEKIHNFLLSVASDQNVTKEHQQIAANLSRETCIPYKSIRKIWFESSPSTRTNLVDLLNGSDFVLSSPKPREKSDELKERLRKLADLAERSEYRELVKDITPKEANEPFSSYKDQIGFGLHVVLIMFTGYLVGYATFRALFNHSAVMNVAGGILGLVGGMLLETLLFIIRASNQDMGPMPSSSRPSSTATSMLKKCQ